MNENPGEMPNPLNPNPAPTPEPTPNTGENVAMQQPIINSQESYSTSVNDATATISPVVNNPSERPMEQASPAAAPEKKKKTGLIIGIIIAAAVMIGGIAAAIMLLNMQQKNPVMAAMDKIMSGKAPANVAIDGNIDISINDTASPISKVKVSLGSELITNSAVNKSVAKITATVRNAGDLSVEFDEVYAGDGDLYFKIDNASSALKEYEILYLLGLVGQMQDVVDCGVDGYCQTAELQELICSDGGDCDLLGIDDTELNVLDGGQNVLSESTIAYFASLKNVIEVIDGEWLKVSVDELNMLNGGLVNDSAISCITDFVSGVNTSSNTAAALYKKYPFIDATNDNVKSASKQHPVYQISLDSKNFANFVNSIQNPEVSGELYSCLGWGDNIQVSTEDVEKIVNEMPAIYAEVDGNDNFTRLSLASDLGDGEATVSIDLSFSYPSSINVTEPDEYQNFSDVIQEIMSSVYDLYFY